MCFHFPVVNPPNKKFPIAKSTPQPFKRPVAPPVYRPQPTPRVLQRSVACKPPATTQRTVTAPAVYRPQPVPAVLQRKTHCGPGGFQSPRPQPTTVLVNRSQPARHAPVHVVPAKPQFSRQTPPAPQPYRPTAPAVQPKSANDLNRNTIIQRQQQQAGTIKQPTNVGPSVIQLAKRYVVKGSVVPSTWTFLKTTKDGLYDVYEDNSSDKPLNALGMTRDAMKSLPDEDDLSDLELSDTEIDSADTEKRRPKKVYRIKNVRDSYKLVKKVLKKKPTKNYGVRIAGGSMFRVEGKTTQVYIKPVAKVKLVQSDGSQARGYEPKKISSDLPRTGKAGSYKHVMAPLAAKGVDVGQALYDRFIATTSSSYPSTFSKYERYLMDEAFTVLSIAEVFRSDYAVPLFVASSRALINGAEVKQVFYKGTGQIDAWHPGASSFSDAKISGQLMEQNLGLGVNNPHPTQKSMNISKSDFKYGAERTQELFDTATDSGSNYFKMLSQHMMPAFSIGARDITALVTSERASPFTGARKSVKLRGGTRVAEDDSVIYKKVNYTVKNVTATGWVQLI